uniref:Uncharacterized protein n=1 Tax=Arundo donax TaxID=35708 RepID=A0A0A9ETR7_ARUDO
MKHSSRKFLVTAASWRKVNVCAEMTLPLASLRTESSFFAPALPFARALSTPAGILSTRSGAATATSFPPPRTAADEDAAAHPMAPPLPP